MLSDVVTSIGHQYLCLHPTTRSISVSTRISTTVVPFLALPALDPRQGNMSEVCPLILGTPDTSSMFSRFSNVTIGI
jgi:hypothetical protein